MAGGGGGGWRRARRSAASGVTDWHFHDVSQIIPRDGWAELELRLINPSTDGMCRSRPPAQLFLTPTTTTPHPPGRSAGPDTLEERMTNERGGRGHAAHACLPERVRVCLLASAAAGQIALLKRE